MFVFIPLLLQDLIFNFFLIGGRKPQRQKWPQHFWSHKSHNAALAMTTDVVWIHVFITGIPGVLSYFKCVHYPRQSLVF